MTDAPKELKLKVGGVYLSQNGDFTTITDLVTGNSSGTTFYVSGKNVVYHGDGKRVRYGRVEAMVHSDDLVEELNYAGQ